MNRPTRENSTKILNQHTKYLKTSPAKWRLFFFLTSVCQFVSHDVHFSKSQNRSFMNENLWISNKISLRDVPCGLIPWWRHQMETFSVLLALCAWNSPVNSPHKGQSRGVLINGWVNNREAGDLRRQRANYDVVVVHNNSALVQVKAWCLTDNNPLAVPMMTNFIDTYMLYSDSIC